MQLMEKQKKTEEDEVAKKRRLEEDAETTQLCGQ